MTAALDNLTSAKHNLESATSDKGGHRDKAIKYVNWAIDEINKGIGWRLTPIRRNLADLPKDSPNQAVFQFI